MIYINLYSCVHLGDLRMSKIQLIYYIPIIYCFLLIMKERTFVKKRANYDYFFLLCCTLISCIGNEWLISSTNLGEALLSQKLTYIGSVLLMHFTFMLITNTCKIHFPNVLRIALEFISIISVSCAMTIGKNNLFYKEVTLVTDNGFSYLSKVYGPLHGLYTSVVFFYMIGALGIAIYSLFRPALISRARAFTFAMCESVCILIYFLEKGLGVKIELLAFAYAIAITIYGFSTKKIYLYDANRVANDFRESSSDYAVVLFDNRKRYVGSNAAAVELFPNMANYYVEQAIADTYEEKTYFEKTLNQFDAIVRDNTENSDSSLQSILEKNGRIFNVSVRKLINETVKGDRGYIIEFIDDTKDQENIRTINKMNLELEKAVEDAKAASKAKSQFLANMSHEIRTPINAVLGLNSIILRDTSEENIREYAADVDNSGKSLLSLINDILDFSKIEAGRMDIVPIEYNLSSLILDCQNMMYGRINDKGLAFELNCDDSIPSVLLGDEIRIRQIVINLLTNAVKYTPSGKVTLSVSYKSYDNESIMLTLSVSDTGIGISEEDQKHLFESFKRLDEKKNRNIEGTGLGLSLVNQLTSLMKGEVSVHSVIGEGSTFSVSIPQKIISNIPVGKISSGYKKKTHIDAMDDMADKTGRILVVDDVLLNLKVMQKLLSKTQLTVDVVNSGAKAITISEENKYDLIFLDHMMPEMDGIETLHNMKEDKSNLNLDTPIVMLTANAIEGIKDEYINEGFDDYLAKPVTYPALKNMICKFIKD